MSRREVATMNCMTPPKHVIPLYVSAIVTSICLQLSSLTSLAIYSDKMSPTVILPYLHHPLVC